MLNVEYSPPCKGGVAAASTKSCEATESAADGVVAHANTSNKHSLKYCLRATTPAAPFRNGSIFIYGASTPPLRGGEQSARFQFVHSHVHRRPLQFGNRRSRLNF